MAPGVVLVLLLLLGRWYVINKQYLLTAQPFS
jgi:hypothetical protein